MSDFVREQSPPKIANGDVWLLVLKDMEARRQGGIEKYGVPVQPHNGRDALIDAYQECLDMCVYLRQAIEERATARNARSWDDAIAYLRSQIGREGSLTTAAYLLAIATLGAKQQ